MPSGNKPLPEPVLTKVSNAIWRHRRPQYNITDYSDNEPHKRFHPFLRYFEQNFLTLYKFMNRGYQIFFNNIFTRNADIYSDDDIHYRYTSNIKHTKSQKLNVYRLVLQLSLPNPLKPGVKSRLNMKLEQRWHAMLQLNLVINKLLRFAESEWWVFQRTRHREMLDASLNYWLKKYRVTCSAPRHYTWTSEELSSNL